MVSPALWISDGIGESLTSPSNFAVDDREKEVALSPGLFSGRILIRISGILALGKRFSADGNAPPTRFQKSQLVQARHENIEQSGKCLGTGSRCRHVYATLVIETAAVRHGDGELVQGLFLFDIGGSDAPQADLPPVGGGQHEVGADQCA